MLKLKKNVVEFIKTFVKPEKLDEVKFILERAIQAELRDDAQSFNYCFSKEQSFRPITMLFTLDDFQEVEDLKPYKWHPAEKWDGNPKRYWIVELDGDGCVDCYDTYLNELIPEVTHFMFIEPIKEQEND